MPQIEADDAGAAKKGTISVAQFADMHGWDTSHETREITDLKMGQSEAKLKKSMFFAESVPGLKGNNRKRRRRHLQILVSPTI